MLDDEDLRRLLALGQRDPSVRYEPIAELGEGGMGVVVAVWDHHMLREVARKTLRDDDPGERERFLREARIAAQLEHPNIVPVYDLDDGASPAFVMRRIRGSSLADLMQRGGLGTLGERLDIFKKVCDAMGYAHDCGVVHRDLKPANVMVGHFGEVQVVDWGLARVAGSPERASMEVVRGDAGASAAGSAIGTPRFMAPEQRVGGPVDERTDVYGLGRLLACLVAGRALDVDEAVPGPWELRAIVARATAEDPDERHPTAAALRGDVLAFQERRPVASLRYSPLQRAVKGLDRHRRVALAIMLTGLVAAMTLIATVGWQTQRHLTALRLARNEAVAASQRAEAELAGAEIALAWASMGRGDLGTAPTHLDRAAELPGDHEIEVALGRAWLAHRIGRPLRSLDIPASLRVRYLSDGRIALETGRGISVVDADGEVTRVADGELVEAVTAGMVRWHDQGLEVLEPDGRVRWRHPWPTAAPPNVRRDAAHERVAAAGDGVGTRVFDAATGRVVATYPGVESVFGVSRSGHRVVGAPVTGSRHRAVDVMQVVGADGLVGEHPGHMVSRLSADGTWLASLDQARDLVRIAHTSGAVIREVPAPGATSITLYGDELHICAPPAYRILEGSRIVQELELPACAMDRSPDGERVVVVEPGARLSEWGLGVAADPVVPTGTVTDLEPSPDGELVAVVGWGGNLVVVDAVSLRVLLDLPVDPQGLRAAAWSPDGRRVAVAGRGGRAAEVDVARAEVRWLGPERDTIAMDVHYADGVPVVGWEDGRVTHVDGSDAAGSGVLSSLWAVAPGGVVSGRDDFDPAAAAADGTALGPTVAGYGLARRGDQAAIGTGRGMVIADLSTGQTTTSPTPITLLDAAFLGDDTVLGAGFDGGLWGWRRRAGTWEPVQPLGLSAVPLISVATHGDVVWIATSEGRLIDLHLRDGRTAGLRDALRGGWAAWLSARRWSGLDATRVHAALGDLEAARRAAELLDTPTGRIWSRHLNELAPAGATASTPLGPLRR